MIRNNYLTIYRIRYKAFVSSLQVAWKGKKGIIAAFCSITTIFGIFFFTGFHAPAVSTLPASSTAPEQGCAQAGPLIFSQTTIASLFPDDYFYQPCPPPAFPGMIDNRPVTVFTTLVPELQSYVVKRFKRYRPLLASGVIVDATTGAVYVMANYTDAADTQQVFPDDVDNYCLYGGFPAASLIKIVTAAAVMEKKGFNITHSLPVSGGFYTLYKHQLGLKKQRFRAQPVTLKKAFSKSINPFFGKLGIQYLNDEEFTEIARSFLFNVPMAFDLPLQRSSVFNPETDFERAERASGFNTRTTISPLHAALIASLPIGDGKIMRPYLIDRIVADSGKDLYWCEKTLLSQPLSKKNVLQLSRLMQATVSQGTARKSFRRLRRTKGYQDWTLGGKTGAINLPNLQRRCEWYAGFAEKGDVKLGIALVIVHKEQRTVKPSFVAAELIKGCFKQKVAQTESAGGRASVHPGA